MPSTSRRASVLEWAQAALLAANLAWTTLCLGGYRAEARLVTLVLTAALVAVHAISLASAGWRSRASAATGGTALPRLRTHPAGWFLLPFLAYAAANVRWMSPVPWLGWQDWLGWAQLVAVFWVVLNGIRAAATRRAVFLTLVALGLIGVLLACHQRFVQPDWMMLGFTQRPQFLGRASGCFGTPNAFAAFLVLLLPPVAALLLRRGASAGERVWWGWVLAVLALGLGLTISRGAWLGLAVACALWPLAHRRWTWRRRALGTVAVLLALFAGGLVVNSAAPAVRARFRAFVENSGERSRPIMWRAAWRLFRAEPLWGTGGGSYNVLFERHRPEQFLDEPQWAHNDYLNTLSDYGLVGFACLFGAVTIVTAVCWRRRRRADAPRPAGGFESASVRGGLAIGLLAFASQLLIDFHLQVPALSLACATLAALLVTGVWPAPRRGAGPDSPLALVAPLLVAAAALGSLGWILPVTRGEALRQRARDGIDRLAVGAAESEIATYRERLREVRPWLEQAVRLAPANGQAWSDLAYATALQGVVEPARVAELGRAAEAAAARALGRSPAVYEFWIRRGVARDMQGRWFEAGEDFTTAVRLAPANAYAWYYYAYHLSLRPTERMMTDAALAFCLRLDPGNRAAITLRQRLAIRPTAP